MSNITNNRNRRPKNTSDLRKRTVNQPQVNERKKSMEERMENSFINFPALAKKQQAKVVWGTTFVLSGIIVAVWFYLLTKGVLFPAGKKTDDLELAKLTTNISSNFSNFKQKFNQEKDIIATIKKELEAESLRQTLVNNLKMNLTNASGAQENVLKVDYPTADSYIGNPVLITGKGQITGAQFEALVKDSNNNILGQTSSLTADEKTLSLFSLELNYISSQTENGLVEIYPIKDGQKDQAHLISLPIKFIPNLNQWQSYQNKEFGFSFQYPLDWSALIIASDDNLQYLQLSQNQQPVEESKEELIKTEDFTEVHYYNNINQFVRHYRPEDSKVYNSLDQLLTSIETEKKVVNFGGLNFTLLPALSEGAPNYYVVQKDAGEVFSFSAKTKNSLEVLEKILVTFRLINPDLKVWKTYQNEDSKWSLKYPEDLNSSDETGQLVFKSDNPSDFDFYLFSIEPQIENLPQWVAQSSLNLKEEVVVSEHKIFGDITDGIYYQTKNISQAGTTNQELSSLGYVFNYNNITYIIKTDKTSFPNTFNNVLGSVRVEK